MGPAPARFGLWFALALAVPAAFFVWWLWLVPGGGIARARADEQRTAGHVLAFAGETLDAELARHASDRIVLQLDAQRRVVAPFADAADTQHTAALAEQAALAHCELGAPSAALPYFAHAAANDELTPVGWLRYVDALRGDDAPRAQALLQQAVEQHAYARCGGLPFEMLTLLHELRSFPPTANARAAWFDRFWVLALDTPAAALLAVLDTTDLAFAPRGHALRAAATLALRHRHAPAPTEETRTVDGICLQPVGAQAVAVVDPQVLDAARELALRSPMRSGPEWRLEDALGAPPDAARREFPLLGTTLAAVPTTTPSSALLQASANAAWLLALATFVVGNLLLWRLTRRELQLVRLRADFVDVVSHELRTPLAALSLKAEMLAQGDVPPERREHYVAALRHDVQRLGDQVERILAFDRLQKGAPLRVEPLAARTLLARGLRAGRPALRLVGQQLELDAARALPQVRCDVEVLTRALRNLLENAAKYAPPGSTVVVRAFASARELVVEVQDRGPGVPADERGAIFQPFVRGSSAGPGTAGSGLGLALVAAAAHSHGGRVAVLPRDGGGSTFTLRLPIVATEAS
ncbi:MAG: HAMP domain-containing histidine kinase [Planctomycetes bacterium]|nr:HAMP domain-containing histidine kinase [Planctomycetota bacterium]